MHAWQWDVSVDTVRRLVAQQFPAWRDLPVVAAPSTGTDNALFRLGDAIVLRFPPFPRDQPDQLLVARATLATIANRVNVEIPLPLAFGAPGPGYPGSWTAFRWIPGETASASRIADLDVYAADLAQFVRVVHETPTGGQGWDGRSRGGPLLERDAEVRACIEASRDLVDVRRVEAAWDECVATPRGRADDCWIHADLMPGNLLLRDGRLVAVIDWESLAVGDPAVDLMPVWNLLPDSAREVFREALVTDDETWLRGRGWALCQAIVALPYYKHTNKVMAETAVHTLNALLE